MFQLIENKQIRSGRKISNRYNNNVTKIGGCSRTNTIVRRANDLQAITDTFIGQVQDSINKDANRAANQNKRQILAWELNYNDNGNVIESKSGFRKDGTRIIY